jgi:uncharacterized Zn-binding protein involved in type VI secretion
MDDFALTELVGRIGNLYTRHRLSPPFHIRDAARRWLGLSQDEIIAVIEKHFADCRRFYTCGSGDAHFGMVESAIRKATEAKHPARAYGDDELVRPRHKRGVRKIHNASGFPDVIVDGGPAARLLRDSESNVERPSGLVGYEDGGDPIGEDDEADT